jgi:FtsH-binding integral membrane protein
MKKTLGTIMAAAAVILLTATFGFAEYAAAGTTDFPYFQLGCLIVGGLMMVSLKRKYEKMYVSEVVGVFALYAILMALFTSPVIEAVKTIAS